MFARTANSKARRRLVEQEDDGSHAEPIQRDGLASSHRAQIRWEYFTWGYVFRSRWKTYVVDEVSGELTQLRATNRILIDEADQSAILYSSGIRSSNVIFSVFESEKTAFSRPTVFNASSTHVPKAPIHD